MDEKGGSDFATEGIFPIRWQKSSGSIFIPRKTESIGWREVVCGCVILRRKQL